MAAVRMHEDEVETGPALVGRLLAAQFPQWASLPIRPVKSAGTDNALYRLGDEFVVRLPSIYWAVDQVEKEHRWLPRLAPHLPLAVPTPLAMGEPGEGYPWRWSVYRWIDGENAALEEIADPGRAAEAMAEFILALQEIDATGGPPARDHNPRGLPLAARDAATREAIAALEGALEGMIDRSLVTAVWESSLRAADWERERVWFHGDLLPGNLLFRDGRLQAIIDFGGLGVGDPACDLMIAWGLFAGDSRERFRAALGVDEATWIRGRGHALSQALIFIPYYLDSNPVGVGYARRALNEVLADFRLNG